MIISLWWRRIVTGMIDTHPSNQHILVTGGAGYIGSVLVPMLLDQRYQVTLFDAFLTAEPEAFPAAGNPNLTILKGDVRDEKAVRACFSEGIDAVIYLAGISDGRAGRVDPALTEDVNVQAFRRFANIAKAAGCRRFVFASTFGVYGYGYCEPLVESMPARPAEPYSLSKFKGERILHSLDAPSFVTVSLRLAMIYGYSPNMRLDFVLNRLIHDALTLGKITVIGGAQVRPQLHIKDACDLFVSMLKQPAEKIAGQVFNACGLNESMDWLAEEISNRVDAKITVEKVPGRQGEHSFELNQDKLSRITGFKPAMQLSDAIREIELHLLTTPLK